MIGLHYDSALKFPIHSIIIPRFMDDIRPEKTLHGHLVKTYSRMKSRTNGKAGNKQSRGYWMGLDILSREEFYEWATTPEYSKLWETWRQSKFKQKLTPSIDRINPEEGYVIGNMEWVTTSENARRARLSIRNKRPWFKIVFQILK